MKQTVTLKNATLWLMTITSGLVVANIYYNQPLLSLIAEDFEVGEMAVSKIPVMTQMGYACGLLFIVPLGDKVWRRKLVLLDLVAVIICLIWIYFSKDLWMLYVANFILGGASVVPQLFVPMAAEFSSLEKRSSNIGMVMSGLLLGILLSRMFSGIVGDLWGWRMMYLIAVGLMLFTWTGIYKLLPDPTPNFKGSYSSLLRSVVDMARRYPLLRLASFRGAMAFAGMSAVFTSLVFHLEGPPFYVGATVVGSFGLVGAVGALAAASVGRFTRKWSNYRIVLAALLILLTSWTFTFGAGETYWGLVIGVILLDLGLQASHIMNQTDFFAIDPKATNRLNTVYMVSYFIGGSLGTLTASWAWEQAQWAGVCAIGFGFNLLALLAHVIFAKKVYN
ncbi:MFS transporter [Sphingobacterium faecale]|uniref:MFS transporter n=1 Tax=Sphingobacterium faecale TaxID=2803775 RepID=A0ABS1R3T5_9SPHI|nr:MFS transporter [Sphingobacterium faecale]MBL1409358.1 MFS transporter [Sphingobacterium faecale]